jgi:uncharacterized membrane protein YwaF
MSASASATHHVYTYFWQISCTPCPQYGVRELTTIDYLIFFLIHLEIQVSTHYQQVDFETGGGKCLSQFSFPEDLVSDQ